MSDAYDNSIAYLDNLSTEELVGELKRREDALVAIVDDVERTRSAVEAASCAVLARFIPSERWWEAPEPEAEPREVVAAPLRRRLAAARLRLVEDEDAS